MIIYGGMGNRSGRSTELSYGQAKVKNKVMTFFVKKTKNDCIAGVIIFGFAVQKLKFNKEP